jgi:hypothetical protein
MFKTINYLSFTFLVISSIQYSCGSQTKLLLDYTCIGINRSSSSSVIKELDFFLTEGLLKGDLHNIDGITITNFIDRKAIEPVAGEQSASEEASIVILNSKGRFQLEIAIKNYIALRLAGVSQTLALILSRNDGRVAWGEFKIDLKNFTKLEEIKKNQIQYFFDFKSSYYKEGQLFYSTDGEVVRLLLLDQSLTQVIWEGALDSRNFHDPIFNKFIENLLMKNKFSLDDNSIAKRKILALDKILQTRVDVNWINPTQITCIKNIHPTYSEED